MDTATRICSVVLAENGRTIAIRESNEEKSHAVMLTVFVEEIMKETQLEISRLDAVAISKGPGSYTGLRIGVSTAKGLCYGSGISLLGISTLRAMTNGVKVPELLLLQNEKNVKRTLLCPMIDARRMEVFTAIYNNNGEELMPVKAVIIDENTFDSWLKDNYVLFFGDGAEKCREIIKHPNAIFTGEFNYSAKNMVQLAEEFYRLKKIEDVAYFEPYYLKDFITTIPRKNIVH